jgi:hypothetical protein
MESPSKEDAAMAHHPDGTHGESDIGAASSHAGEGMSDTRNNEFLPSNKEQAAKGAGGLGGAAAGAAIGAMAGPVGAVIGGLAGAVGGWWAGKGIADATSSFDSKEEEYYRSHYESDPNRPADRRYEDVRPYYMIGHIAAHNPDYRTREFDDIEPELQKGWASRSDSSLDWTGGRSYARTAFTRRRLATESTLGAGAGNAANIAGGSVVSPR